MKKLYSNETVKTKKEENHKKKNRKSSTKRKKIFSFYYFIFSSYFFLLGNLELTKWFLGNDSTLFEKSLLENDPYFTPFYLAVNQGSSFTLSFSSLEFRFLVSLVCFCFVILFPLSEKSVSSISSIFRVLFFSY